MSLRHWNQRRIELHERLIDGARFGPVMVPYLIFPLLLDSQLVDEYYQSHHPASLAEAVAPGPRRQGSANQPAWYPTPPNSSPLYSRAHNQRDRQIGATLRPMVASNMQEIKLRC